MLQELKERTETLFLKGRSRHASNFSMARLRIEGFSTLVSIGNVFFDSPHPDEWMILVKETPERDQSSEAVWGGSSSRHYILSDERVEEYKETELISQGEATMQKLKWILEHCEALTGY